MRKLSRSIHDGWRRQPSFQPAEVVIADIRNPVENPHSRGKARPVVLIRGTGSSWEVLGLTRKHSFADGTPRIAVPSPLRVGLDGPGFLWSGRLARISAIDVQHHLGWIDHDLAMLIIVVARLDDLTAQELLNGARRCRAESLRPDGGDDR